MRAAGCPAGADRKRSSAERGVLGGDVPDAGKVEFGMT